jgi:hypothetical protein
MGGSLSRGHRATAARALYPIATFTARTDGELFLFVNDVLVALPGLWSHFTRLQAQAR